jgi:hypothetical protein
MVGRPFATERIYPYSLEYVAQALASDVRQCSLTNARLPRHFLVTFSTRVSRALHKHNENLRKGEKPWLSKPVAYFVSLHHSKVEGEALATSSYLINRSDALEQVDRRGHWRSLVTERMKQRLAVIVQKSYKSLVVKDHWVWTKGDATLQTAEQLEREAYDAAVTLFEHDGGSLLVLSGAVSPGRSLCTLLFDNSAHDNTSLEPDAGTPAAVYELSTLLSPERSTGLQSKMQGNGTFTVVKHDLSVRLQMALDRLISHKESKALAGISWGKRSLAKKVMSTNDATQLQWDT